MRLKSSVATSHPRTIASAVITRPLSKRAWVVLIISALASLAQAHQSIYRRSKGLQRTHTSNKAANNRNCSRQTSAEVQPSAPSR